MRKTLAHSAWVLCGIVLLVGSPARSLEAQVVTPMAEAHCMECFNLPAIGGPAGTERAHIFSYHSIGIWWNYMDCHAFNACHTSFDQPKYCADFHWVCGSGSQALGQTRDAIRRGDSGALADLVSGTNSLVAIVEDHALVYDCNRDSILGAVRIPVAMRLSMQGALRSGVVSSKQMASIPRAPTRSEPAGRTEAPLVL
jgi:hypothetical protein